MTTVEVPQALLAALVAMALFGVLLLGSAFVEVMRMREKL